MLRNRMTKNIGGRKAKCHGDLSINRLGWNKNIHRKHNKAAKKNLAMYIANACKSKVFSLPQKKKKK